MRTILALILRAASEVALPSTIAIRLATGLRVGSASSESAWVTRTVSGSRSSSSPATVAIRVSCPWPEVVVDIAAVTWPCASTRIRQDSTKVVTVSFSLRSCSKMLLPPPGSRQVAMPIPASLPAARAASRLATRAS